LRQHVAGGGLGRLAHLDAHGGQVGDGLDQDEVALVGRGLEREGGQDSIADSQECPARIDYGVDELAVAHFPEAVRVRDHRHLRRDRLAIVAIQDDQGLACGRRGQLSMRVPCALQAARSGEREKASFRQKCAQTIHA